MILWKLLVLLNVLKNFLILILIKSSLDSWMFESWILILIILESWIFLMKLSRDSCIVLDSILKSFSWAFCHHLCYHQNTLNQSWFINMNQSWFIIMKQWSLLLQSPPFWWWQLWNQETHTHTLFPISLPLSHQQKAEVRNKYKTNIYY